MTEFFRKKMAFFWQVHAFVIKTVRSLAGAIHVTDAVADNARAVVVEGDAWVRNQLIQNGDFSDGLTNWQNHAGSMSILSVDGGRLKVTLPQDGRYGFSQNLSPSIPANHTVLYVFNGFDLSHLSATNISMQVITNGDVWNSTKQNIGSSSNITLYWRRTTAAPVTAITLRCATGNQPGDYYTVSAVQIIDLTQLCNGDAAKIAAITSWADLVAQYPEYAGYVAYDTGTVVGLQAALRSGEGSYYGGTASTETLYAAGAAHDTQDVVSGEVTRRIGVVDLGTLKWTYVAPTTSYPSGRFYASINGKQPGMHNFICSRYSVGNISASNDRYIHGNETLSAVTVVDSSLTQETVPAALSGVMLYYELATPATSTVTAQPLALQKGANSIYQTDAGRTASFEMTYTATP